MKIEMQKPMMGRVPPSSWGRRLAWLAGIWLLSIAVLAVMAFGMRLLMSAAGMTVGQGGREIAAETRGAGNDVSVPKEPPDAAGIQAAAVRQARGVERS